MVKCFTTVTLKDEGKGKGQELSPIVPQCSPCPQLSLQTLSFFFFFPVYLYILLLPLPWQWSSSNWFFWFIPSFFFNPGKVSIKFSCQYSIVLCSWMHGYGTVLKEGKVTWWLKLWPQMSTSNNHAMYLPLNKYLNLTRINCHYVNMYLKFCIFHYLT